MRDFSNLQHPEQEYKKFLAEGKFMLQRSRDSGKFFFYPRIAEPVTGSTNLEWAAPSGLGTVYAVTVERAKPPAPNYNVVLVDLAEGPRLMSRVEGIAPEAVKIGMKVKARVIRQGEEGVVVFDPA